MDLKNNDDLNKSIKSLNQQVLDYKNLLREEINKVINLRRDIREIKWQRHQAEYELEECKKKLKAHGIDVDSNSPKTFRKPLRFVLRILASPFILSTMVLGMLLDLLRQIVLYFIYGGEILIFDRNTNTSIKSIFDLVKKQSIERENRLSNNDLKTELKATKKDFKDKEIPKSVKLVFRNLKSEPLEDVPLFIEDFRSNRKLDYEVKTSDCTDVSYEDLCRLLQDNVVKVERLEIFAKGASEKLVAKQVFERLITQNYTYNNMSSTMVVAPARDPLKDVFNIASTRFKFNLGTDRNKNYNSMTIGALMPEVEAVYTINFENPSLS